MQVRLCGFRHISTSGLGVGATRASFIAFFGRPLQVTVRRMTRTILSVLSILSVTLVYYGQTVEWIRIALGMEIGLGPGDIVLDGTQIPTERSTSAPSNFFSGPVYCGQTVAHLMLTCDTVSAQPNSITLFASLRDLRHCVAKTHTTLQTLVNVIVISWLFYCNNVLVSLLAYPTQRLQSAFVFVIYCVNSVTLLG